MGKLLLEHMLKLGWLKPMEEKRFRLTDEGRRGLVSWGISLDAIDAEKGK